MKKSQSSDYINGLEKTLGVDKEGNLTARKGLEVDGLIKANSGFKPIHTYFITDLDDTEYEVDVYLETFNPNTGYYSFLGKYKYDDFQLCLGSYKLSEDGKISELNVINFYDTPVPQVTTLTSGGDWEFSEIAYKLQTQKKLYKHNLKLTADGKIFTLFYLSTSRIYASSIADLRTVLGIAPGNDSILPVCADDLSGTAVLQVTTTLCKIGAANVTAVSDSIMSL